MGGCIKCHGDDVENYRGDNGHWCRRCRNCGHDWGPFVSSYGEATGQSTLGDW